MPMLRITDNFPARFGRSLATLSMAVLAAFVAGGVVEARSPIKRIASNGQLVAVQVVMHKAATLGVDDAVGEYRAALEVHPGHIQTVQALTRCRLRHDGEHAQHDSEVVADLRDIALRGDSQDWREWARRQLTRLHDQG